MGSVSMVDGHIDPDKNKMTAQEALSWVEDYEKAIKEEQAIVNNGDEFHVEALKVCEVVKYALEKQIPKKVKMTKELYPMGICPCCENEFIPHTGFEHCHYCGQALDWSDTE